MKFSTIVRLIGGIALLCASAFTQTVSSSLVGTLTDPGNAVISDVEVVLTNQGTGAVQRTRSNSVGLFRFPNLLTGAYSVNVQATGFAPYTESNIVISASETRDLGRIVLQLRSLVEQVTVTAEATPLQTASSEKSSLLTGTQLESVALKGRDFFGMMRLIPGVVDTAARDVTSNQGTMGSLTYNGTASGLSNYAVDGISANDTGSNNDIHFNGNMDAIAEVRVMTGNYQAEFGRKGGAQISVITKGGSREFHGGASWTHRHEQFNANSFFNNRSGVVKSPYRFNVAGYNIGGPIYIPRLFNTAKDKLFVFFAQEYTRQRTNLSNQYRTMPTALERTGDFSKSVDTSGKMIPITDPVSRAPFPGNIIPSGRIDPTGKAILSFFPQSNYIDADPNLVNQRNYLATASGVSPRRNDTLRVDANPSSSLRVYWRFIQEPETLEAPWGGWGSGSSDFLLPSWFRRGRPGRGHAINVTSTLSPTLVNEFSFGKSYAHIYYSLVDDSKLSRSLMNNVPQWYKGDISAAKGTSRQGFGAGWINEDLVPDVSFGGTPVNAPTLNLANPPYENWNDIWTFTDNVSKVMGSHNLKAGIYVEHTGKFATLQGGNDKYRGAFDFGRNVNNPYDSGHGFSNALLGSIGSYTESTRKLTHDLWFTNAEWFVQDNWRVTRRLTLDIGMRFYWLGPVSDHAGTISGFDPASYSFAQAPQLYTPGFDATGKRVAVDPGSGSTTFAALIGTFVPGTGSLTNGIRIGGQDGYPSGMATYASPLFAPRVGFAYDVFGNGTMAVRGGFGISYDRDGTASLWENQAAPPFIARPTMYYGNLSTFADAAGSVGPTSLSFATGEMKPPSSMNYSLGIQRSLGFQTVLDASYVGNQARHLTRTRQINSIPVFARYSPANADPTNPKQALPDNFLRPYKGWDTIGMYEYAGSSNYNSLQISLRRQFARGLMFGASYTWSRYMSYGTPSVYLPERTRSYGPSGGDRRQILTINYFYEVPKLSSRFGGNWLAPIVDGWSVSGITSLTTGAPFTPGYSTTYTVETTGSSEGARINVVGDSFLPEDQRTFYRNFRTEAFAPPVPCSAINQSLACFGNAGTNIMYGPGMNNWDISVDKKIPIGLGEGRELQLRAEAYNAWNHTQFSGYDTSARYDATGKQTNANFGAYNAARTPRIMAFTLRLRF
jgi:hypothetical protein